MPAIPPRVQPSSCLGLAEVDSRRGRARVTQVCFTKLRSFQSHERECIGVSQALVCRPYSSSVCQCVRSLIYWKINKNLLYGQNSKKGEKLGLNTTGVRKCKSSCYPARTLSSCMISIMNKFSLPGVTL